jgi:hypothetical protein
MELSNRPCIISCGIGPGYVAGVDRLERSLLFNGWLGETMFWRNYPDGCPSHRGQGQYNFKPFCFQEAFKRGHKIVLWCDASLYAIKDPMPIMDYVNDHGLYFFKSGYPLSATATDKLLKATNEKREDLTDVPEFATGCVGVNIENPNGNMFFEGWAYYMKNGLFGGNRVQDLADSSNPLFKFSRQDQSAASMALHKMKITTSGEDKNWCSYYPSETKDTIFFIKGI